MVYNATAALVAAGPTEPYTTRYQWPSDKSYKRRSRPGQRARRARGQGAAQVRGGEGRDRRHDRGAGLGQDGVPVRGLARPQRRVRDVQDRQEDASTSRRCRCARTRTTPKSASTCTTATRSSTTWPRAPTRRWSASTQDAHEQCLLPRLGAIHCTALDDGNFSEWAPQRRLGDLVAVLEPLALPRHDRVDEAATAGLRVCLGADWSPSGSKNLLGELKVADMWNRDHLASPSATRSCARW